MDPTNFYHLGQIRHQETVREAENYRLAQALRTEPTLLQRFRARLSARLPASPARQAVSAWRVEASST